MSRVAYVNARVFTASDAPLDGVDREVDAIRSHGVFDAMTTLAAVAAVTTRVRIGTAVHLPALRHPIVVAREIATIDQLSGGRVSYGVGVGRYRPEYEILDVKYI